MSWLWDKGRWILLIIGVFSLLVLAKYTGLERNRLSFVEIWMRTALAPLESGVTAVTGKINSAGQFFAGYQALYEENQVLKQDVNQLRNELNQMTEYQLENIRLRDLLALRESTYQDRETIPARVIRRHLDNWHQTMVINKGSNHGITRNMAVVNHDGLVGRVIAVSDTTAEVLLVLDAEGATGGLVQISRTPGVLEGSSEDPGMLRMIHIPHDAQLAINQVVVTSGFGGIYPKGIRIGYITDVIVEPNGLMKTALVKPFVDFNRLEEVLVIKQ